MNHDEDWRSEEDKDIDLELENRSLELELELKGGNLMVEEDVDPKLHNTFLKQTQQFNELEESPRIPVRSLFPDEVTFEPVDTLSKKEIQDKLETIMTIFSTHNIFIDLKEKLPAKLVYKYLTEDFIPNETTYQENNTSFSFVIDGCDGYCPGCFQKEYCEVKDEIFPDDECEKWGE